jgi:uncharacterized membrane protein
MVTLLTPAVLVHTLAAASALLVGTLVLLGGKGGARHRSLGRSWMILMLVVALSSFAIRTHGHFSWLHLLSLVTLAGVARAVWAARARRIATHRATVVSLYSGGLVIAGIFTLLPQRLLGHALWAMLGWL